MSKQTVIDLRRGSISLTLEEGGSRTGSLVRALPEAEQSRSLFGPWWSIQGVMDEFWDAAGALDGLVMRVHSDEPLAPSDLRLAEHVATGVCRRPGSIQRLDATGAVVEELAPTGHIDAAQDRVEVASRQMPPLPFWNPWRGQRSLFGAFRKGGELRIKQSEPGQVSLELAWNHRVFRQPVAQDGRALLSSPENGYRALRTLAETAGLGSWSPVRLQDENLSAAEFEFWRTLADSAGVKVERVFHPAPRTKASRESFWLEHGIHIVAVLVLLFGFGPVSDVLGVHLTAVLYAVVLVLAVFVVTELPRRRRLKKELHP